MKYMICTKYIIHDFNIDLVLYSSKFIRNVLYICVLLENKNEALYRYLYGFLHVSTYVEKYNDGINSR